MLNQRVAVRMILIVVLAGAFLLTVVPAMAAEEVISSAIVAYGPPDGRGHGGNYGQSNGTGMGFVDADGNGICDNCGTSMGYVDADGDGICDNCGNGMGFVDADGDGVCDYCGTGMGYVDADGNGVCDNWDGTQLGQQGRGRGGRSR